MCRAREGRFVFCLFLSKLAAPNQRTSRCSARLLVCQQRRGRLLRGEHYGRRRSVAGRTTSNIYATADRTAGRLPRGPEQRACGHRVLAACVCWQRLPLHGTMGTTTRRWAAPPHAPLTRVKRRRGSYNQAKSSILWRLPGNPVNAFVKPRAPNE